MSVTNNVITDYVSIDDVQSLLQITDGVQGNEQVLTSDYDLGVFCSSVKINKWAKYKPVRVAQKEPLDNWITGLVPNDNYTLFFINDQNQPVINTAYSFWSHERPLGTTSSPYRLSDFIGYKHDAICPMAAVLHTDSSEYKLVFDGGSDTFTFLIRTDAVADSVNYNSTYNLSFFDIVNNWADTYYLAVAFAKVKVLQGSEPSLHKKIAFSTYPLNNATYKSQNIISITVSQNDLLSKFDDGKVNIADGDSIACVMFLNRGHSSQNGNTSDEELDPIPLLNFNTSCYHTYTVKFESRIKKLGDITLSATIV